MVPDPPGMPRGAAHLTLVYARRHPIIGSGEMCATNPEELPPETMPADPPASATAQDRLEEDQLLAALHTNRPDLESLLERASDHWGYEDPVYRFWHQSFKVYDLQAETLAIVEALRNLAPRRPLNAWFEQILADGTGKEFELSHNQDWLPHTRPIVEAFFHARFFLEMAVRYARLADPPRTLPSGWAAFLYLYDLR